MGKAEGSAAAMAPARRDELFLPKDLLRLPFSLRFRVEGLGFRFTASGLGGLHQVCVRVVLRFTGYYEDVMWVRKSNRLGGCRVLRPRC